MRGVIHRWNNGAVAGDRVPLTSATSPQRTVIIGDFHEGERGDLRVAETSAQAPVLADTANKFDTVNQSLTSMLSKLMGRLDGLQGAWKGMAATEFERVREQYQKDLTDLNRALAETATAIRTSGREYTATDTESASRVTRSGGSYTLPL